MNSSKFNDRNGPPSSVTIVTTGNGSPVFSSMGQVPGQRMPEHTLVIDHRRVQPQRSRHAGSQSTRYGIRYSSLEHQSRHPAIHQIPPAVVSNSGTIQLPHLIRGPSGPSQTPLCSPWRSHDVTWCTSRTATDPRHAAAAAQSPATPSAHHDGHHPNLAMPPDRHWPTHARPQDPMQPYEPAGATIPSAPQPASPWPATCARSRSGMSNSRQNLTVDTPTSTRITSRSSKGPGGSPPTSSTPESQQQPHPTPESTRRPQPQTAAPGTWAWTYPPRSQHYHLQGTNVSNSRSPAQKPAPDELPQQSRSHLAT